MDSAFPARFELEVLDRVGDIHSISVQPGLGHRAIEYRSRRADEGPAVAIFAISRLLADEDDVGSSRTGPKHRLRRVAPQRARSAVGCGVA
jgi:hypothetical protein